MKYEEFSKVFSVFKGIKNLRQYGVDVAMTSDYRKNEYVFSITLIYSWCNFEMKDYANLCFNDSDDNEVTESDITSLINDLNDIIEKFNKVIEDKKIPYIEIEN